MIWIESKYASLLSSRVRNFKRKSSNLWNFTCPLPDCGDNDSKKNRARGYIYESKGKLRYHCHNCGADMKFDKLVQELDNGLYLEMQQELFLDYKETNKPEVVKFAEKMKKPEYIKRTNLSELQKVSQLSPKHPCKQYIDNRKIPTNLHYQLFYAERFKEWTNGMLPGKFDPIKREESRLVIPFLDQNKNLFGYQGRSLDKDESQRVKYLTIMLEDKPRIYGLDRVDFNRKWFCVEGPIDAMFVENCIATAGADIVAELERLKCNKDNGIIVYDNEPRNKDTIKKINKAIRKGWKVVIWPNSPDQKEDINDLALAGLPYMEILNINICHGLEAELRVAQWKRI